MAEWFNAAVLKTVEGATPPRVRISASPPIKKPDFDVRLFFFYGEDASDCAYACLLRAELAIHLGLARQFPLAYHPDVIGFADQNDI